MYNSNIERKLQPTEVFRMEIDKLAEEITNSIQLAAQNICFGGRKRNQNIRAETIALEEKLRRTDRDTKDNTELNKQVQRAIRKDIEPIPHNSFKTL